MAKIDMVHVPFKGSSPSTISQLAGEISVNFPSVQVSVPYIKAGRLRALAVTTTMRSQALPEALTIAEAGLPGYEANQWFGILAPAGTPRPIIDKLYQEIARGLRSPELKERMVPEGMEIIASTSDEFSAYIKSETDKWCSVIMAAGIKPQ